MVRIDRLFDAKTSRKILSSIHPKIENWRQTVSFNTHDLFLLSFRIQNSFFPSVCVCVCVCAGIKPESVQFFYFRHLRGWWMKNWLTFLWNLSFATTSDRALALEKNWQKSSDRIRRQIFSVRLILDNVSPYHIGLCASLLVNRTNCRFLFGLIFYLRQIECCRLDCCQFLNHSLEC